MTVLDISYLTHTIHSLPPQVFSARYMILIKVVIIIVFAGLTHQLERNYFHFIFLLQDKILIQKKLLNVYLF